MSGMQFVTDFRTPNLSFNFNAMTRFHPTDNGTEVIRRIVIHHEGGRPARTVQEVHDDHMGRQPSWGGIGYHFYVTSDGAVFQGRPRTHQGAHVAGHNTDSIGIAAQGNWHEPWMPQGGTNLVPTAPWVHDITSPQRRGIVEIIADCLRLFPNVPRRFVDPRGTGGRNGVTGHGNITATDCPGGYMPHRHLIECGIIYPNVLTAANTLRDQGVINTPSYWINNFHQLEFLGQLIINMSVARRGTPPHTIPSFSTALAHLHLRGVLNDSDYWRNNVHRVQFLEDLFIAVARNTA